MWTYISVVDFLCALYFSRSFVWCFLYVEFVVLITRDLLWYALYCYCLSHKLVHLLHIGRFPAGNTVRRQVIEWAASYFLKFRQSNAGTVPPNSQWPLPALIMIPSHLSSSDMTENAPLSHPQINHLSLSCPISRLSPPPPFSVLPPSCFLPFFSIRPIRMGYFMLSVSTYRGYFPG